MFVQRGQVRIPHVQGYSLDARPLLGGDRRPESIQAALLAILGHIQHAIPLQVVNQRQIFMSFAEGLFIHAQIRNLFGLASC